MSNDEVVAWRTADGVEVTLVPPDIGDGESFYFEVTRHGEVWDGRSPTVHEARLDATALACRLATMQDVTGRNHEGPINSPK